MLRLHHQLSADSVGLNKLMSPGKGGRGFLLQGPRNQFPELGSQAASVSTRPTEHSPTFEKASRVEVFSSNEPSAFSLGVKDSVPFSK